MEARLSCHRSLRVHDWECADDFMMSFSGQDEEEIALSFPVIFQFLCSTVGRLLGVTSLSLLLDASSSRCLLLVFYLFSSRSHVHTCEGTSRTNYGPTITPPTAPLCSRLRNKFIGTSLPLL